MADVAEALLPGGTKGCSADDCKELGNKMLQAGKVCLDSEWQTVRVYPARLHVLRDG
jgi:hypothetical protein